MFSFSCSPRKQSSNRKAGKRKRTHRYPAKSARKDLPTIAEEDYNPEPQSQVNPPFPSHHIFGLSHPPVVGGYGPYTPTGTNVLFNSLPCNQTSDSNTNSDLDNLSYVSTNFNSSSSSMGSADVFSGGKPRNQYGPDRWTMHLEGQTSRGNVDILAPLTDEERSTEVSDARTDELLSAADDEESEDSDLSQVRVIRAKSDSRPQTPQSSSSSNSVSGISPRPRLPTLPTDYRAHSYPPLFRPTHSPFSSELPRHALPLTRATAPRLPRPFTPARTLTPSELSRPARPFKASTPLYVRPPFSELTRPFATPRPTTSFKPVVAPVYALPTAASRPPTPIMPTAASPPQSPMSICLSPNHPRVIQNPPPPGISVMEGRTLRIDPTENIGPFAPAVNSIPVLGSFSVSANLARVPVLNQQKQLVPSKLPRFPTLSPKSKLNIYISSHPVYNLPSHMEQVHRVDLTLDVLFMLVKYDLDHIPPGCKVSFIVVDFVVSKQQSIEWHRTKIFELIDLLLTHPAGNVIRFGLVFIYPSLCIPKTFSKPYKLANDCLPLVTGINTAITKYMTKSCSRSTFGSIGKHVGITAKGKNWKVDAWESFNPNKPSSIIKCSKLTLPYQKRRSFILLNAIESEIRGLPDV